ncbi:MAG: 6-phosphogluconolactonase [Chlamydiae bacterium]|nr:6-phosphogluconolactonase [Chlamydiota bacterium]
MKEYPIDDRRTLIVPGDHEETLRYCVDHWISCANQAIAKRGFFAVALSGGSTPKLIYKRLSSQENSSKVDWSKVFLFWSDERSVSPESPDSNYHMALEEGGLSKLPIPKENIHRMVAEKDIEENARAYETLVAQKQPLDLVMLGVGEDGHTASLFPHTEALNSQKRLVVANHVPQKQTWRMSFTYDCINAASQICLYVLGPGKADILAKVLTSAYDPSTYPSQGVGTAAHKALWIADSEAFKI